MANEQIELIGQQLGLPEAPDGAKRAIYSDDEPIEQRLSDVDGDLHKNLIEELKNRKNFSNEYTRDRHEDWDRVREHKNMYVNLTRNARAGDRSSLGETEMPFERSVVIPLTKATLEVLITQIMSIYASRVPMNQIQAMAGGDPVRAKIIEAMISYDNGQSRAFSALYAMFSDALSFGNGFMYNSWEIDEGITYEFEPLNIGGVPPELQRAVLGPLAYTPIRKIGVQREYCKWTPVSAYDAIPDPRVSMWDLQNGEFFGHRWKSSPHALKKKEGEKGPYFNVDKIPKRHNYSDDTSKLRSSSPDPYNTASEADPKELLRSKTPHFFNLYTMVWELIPSEHGLGSSDYPEKWVFSWAEDKVIVRAHPMVNKHQAFPYACAEPEPNFFDTFSPGTLELIEPLQRFINWLYNSHIENITRVLNNQWVYSPQMIEEMDLEFGGPGEHVRMTQEAAEMMLNGEIQDIRQFLFQMPVQDVTGASYMNAIQYTYQMAQVLTGANDPLSGVQTPTTRSATEIGTITAQATQRMAITARLMDENAIQELIKQSIHNRQQFTSIGRYYEIAGRMAQDIGVDSIFGDLEAIQGDFKYKPITGILPEDPSRSAANWTNLMAAAGQLPQLQQPGPDGRMLDFRSIFNTIAEKSGISNIDDYYMDVQVMPDEQVQAEAQAGNLVPVQ